MMLHFVPFPLLVGILILAISLIILRYQKWNGPHLVCSSIFGVYLLLVVGVVFFPIPLPHDIGGSMTNWTTSLVLSMVNLVPFNYHDCANRRIIFREIVQNILLTIPCGFGINFLQSFRARGFLWLGLAVGLAIEITQLIISLMLAGAYRTVDITDVLLNAAGVLLGYGLFRVFAWLYPAVNDRFNLKHTTLTAYILEVANRAGSLG